jgi:hypothetical protein
MNEPENDQLWFEFSRLDLSKNTGWWMGATTFPLIVVSPCQTQDNVTMPPQGLPYPDSQASSA